MKLNWKFKEWQASLNLRGNLIIWKTQTSSLSGAMQAKIKHPETNKQHHGRVIQCIQTPQVLLTIHQIQDEA